MIKIGEQIWYGTNYCKGLYVGTFKIWPQTFMDSMVGANSGSLWVPQWATSVDVFAVGGGGGGTDGGVLSQGSGGGAGQWATDTWVITDETQIKITPGTGGAGSQDGNPSVITMGNHIVQGSGGRKGAASSLTGDSPPTKTLRTDDRTYTFSGGVPGTCNKGVWSDTITPGQAPGAGGGGGRYDKGARGGDGQCWVVFRNCRKL